MRMLESTCEAAQEFPIADVAKVQANLNLLLKPSPYQGVRNDKNAGTS
jgi:hypothetical protein